MIGRLRKPTPPAPRGAAAATTPPKGILELDRFTGASLARWKELSADLDELQDILYFNLEPERRRLRPALIKALQTVEAVELELKHGVRIVDYQWTLHPLSAAGSLTYVGGRFNSGIDLEGGASSAWPALYIAQDHPTAFREKYQLEVTQEVDGLTPEELALGAGGSHTTVMLKGRLSRVFPLSPASLAQISTLLAKVKMPGKATQLKQKLKIKPDDLRMITTGKQLFNVTAVQNWRTLPVQFSLPAQSQILAELIRAADFEAISYPSSKGQGACLAVFVDQMARGSFIELEDDSPKGAIRRLDESTSEELAGWGQLGLQPANQK